MQGMKTRASVSAGAVPQHSSTTVAAATEASKMLEAALQQMDGIISGTTTTAVVSSTGANGAPGSGLPGMSVISERNLISAKNVLSTAKTLSLALQQVGCAAPAPDPVTAAIISDWLETHIPRQDADERLRRLQRDKESLAVQFQLLNDRVSEQSNKIIELERILAKKTQQLSANEELLQRQMLSRSALETQKLELMSALSELKLHRAALERENVELKGTTTTQLENGNPLLLSQRLPPFGSAGNLNHTAIYGPGNVPKTPPSSLRHQIHPQFHSLPRSNASKLNQNSSIINSRNNNNTRLLDSNTKQRNVAFASNEKILIDDVASTNDLMYGSFTSQGNSTPSPSLKERSSKGLRNIFGKLRRSNSGNLELPTLEQTEQEFRRGGARATAGGRIEWTTQSSQLSNSSKGYADWSPQEVCNWLCDLGLGCYEEDCRKWLKSNTNICFFNVSPIDIEKELNLKTLLHRKKIILAIDELTGKEQDPLALKAGHLDVSWVLRWLDDIGLPQYKDNFLQAKVDGRMLHRLTLEDLAHLHVTSCLHVASLRRGIQCMRETEWNPECLIRRSTKCTNDGEGNDDDDEESENTVQECVSLWTAHRVMEWLRVADLSEYAPNLRGAGIHGALMLYEPRFNANLLADLLSIPPSKTLLRRHIATHFKELLGRDVIHAKRDAEAALGYQPLTIVAKIKPPKKTQFSLKRRKSTKGNEIEWTDYVCPLTTISGDQSNNISTTSSTSTNNSSSINSN